MYYAVVRHYEGRGTEYGTTLKVYHLMSLAEAFALGWTMANKDATKRVSVVEGGSDDEQECKTEEPQQK